MFGENNWIFRPLIVGGIIVGYEYFNNRGQPMMTHLKVGALVAGSSLASGYLGNMLPLPDIIEAMGSPLLTGGTFALGRKFVLGSRNGLLMDAIEVGGAEEFSSIRNIPNVEIEKGKKLISKITEDLIKLLSKSPATTAFPDFPPIIIPTESLNDSPPFLLLLLWQVPHFSLNMVATTFG